MSDARFAAFSKDVDDRYRKMLEDGVTPWNPPEAKDLYPALPTNLVTGKEYRGTNVFTFTFAQANKHYTRPFWGTFKQIKELGKSVRRDEKSTKFVVYGHNPVKTGRTNEKGEEVIFHKPYFKIYSGFNVDQIEGEEEFLFPKKPEDEVITKCNQVAKCFFRNISEDTDQRFLINNFVKDIPNVEQVDLVTYYQKLFFKAAQMFSFDYFDNRGEDPTSTYSRLVSDMAASVFCLHTNLCRSDLIFSDFSDILELLKNHNGDHGFFTEVMPKAYKVYEGMVGYYNASMLGNKGVLDRRDFV